MNEYSVVTSKSLERLIAKVNELLKDNWYPSGNLIVLYDETVGYEYYQAMIKYNTTWNPYSTVTVPGNYTFNSSEEEEK